ncbi:MAG: HYR domain-containing protein [Acidobacteria bacterium]|nr:HYR domain-containing protein [Acidobacteriota bacterium]MBV9479116.1 HYR domain-containing protein [Acidobacteriota bacterium]
MRRILAAVCLVLGATGAMGQVITSLDPPSFKANSGEWFLTANGRYVGDTFVYNGPAGTFKVDANAVDTTFSTAWVPLEVLAKPGLYTLTVEGPNGTTDPVEFKVTSPPRVPNLTLVLPETLVAAARTTKGNYVKYDVTAFGGSVSDAVVRCDPASGSFFYTGTNRVSCTASNSAGETASDVFTISVIDDAPTIRLPNDIVVPPASDRGTFVKYDVTAYDDVDAAAVPVSCKPASGELFPVGLTFVECTASDSVGNVASASFSVNVTDEKPR